MAHRRPKLVRCRESLGLTQEELAQKIGVDRGSLSRWERGASTPRLYWRRRLAEAFNVEVSAVESWLSGADHEFADQCVAETSAAAVNGEGLIASTDRPEGTDVDRRAFLRSGIGAALVGVAGEVGVLRVGAGDVQAVQDMIGLFSQIDQRHGGGHGRAAVLEYLTSDVAAYLGGSFADAAVQRRMFSAAGELAYLVGWMAFDNSQHDSAEHYFRLAISLATEAGDPPLTGHVLRAMAHKAIDLGEPYRAAQLADASVDGSRYAHACPRERALLGVIHARSLIAADQKQVAARTLLQAENDLEAARPDDEPRRVFFFSEAALAHETGCALRDMGDLSGAERELRRSVRLRQAATFARTHSVTLGYLAEVQARRGNIDEAVDTWSTALDTMDSVRSGRARRNAIAMRREMAPYLQRGAGFVGDVDYRTAEYLSR